jgi:hypothetical protein
MRSIIIIIDNESISSRSNRSPIKPKDNHREIQTNTSALHPCTRNHHPTSTTTTETPTHHIPIPISTSGRHSLIFFLETSSLMMKVGAWVSLELFSSGAREWMKTREREGLLT